PGARGGWAGRGLWLGPLAWLVALAGTLLLGYDALLPLAEVLLIAGAGLGVVAWSGVAPRPVWGPAGAPRPLRRLDGRRGLSLAGLGLAAAITWQANSRWLAQPNLVFGPAGMLWLLGMGVLLIAALAWPRPAAGPEAAPQPAAGLSRRAEALVFAGLVVLAVGLRTWDLRDFPYTIHPDEILSGQNAITSFLNGPTPSVFSTIWYAIDLPALWFAGIAAALKIGGISLTVLRLPTAVAGAATVIPFYGFVRMAWGRTAAIAGTAILAVSASNVQYSRVTINNIVTAFFWTVCFFFLLRGLRTRRPLDWVLVGLAGGLSEHAYYGTHLLPFLLLAFAVYLLVVHWRQGWQFLGYFGLVALGYLAGFGPLLAYYTRNPSLYFGRGAGALMWDHIPRDGADLQRMWDTLWPLFAQNLLGISANPDQGTFYWAPLLFPAEAALLALGVALLVWRWRHPPAFLVLLWGLGVLFVGGTLVHGVPFIQHWAPAFPAFYAALAVPIGAWAGSLPRVLSVRRQQLGAAVLALGLLVLAGINVDFYFGHYQVTRPEFEIRAAQARWEADLGTVYRVRTVGRSWQDYSADWNQYLISGQDGGVIYNPAAELPLPGVAGQGLGFVFFPDDEQYLAAVQALYPGGALGEVKSHAGAAHLFYTYVVTPAQAQAAYGVQLDVAAAAGGAYHWSGRVNQVGDLPAAAQGRLVARWSGNLYLPAAGPAHLELIGPGAQLAFDGQPGAPAPDQLLTAGWHRFVVAATLAGPATPRLRLGQNGATPAEVNPLQLWPAAPGAGLLGGIAGPAGLPPQARVDAFIGFSAIGEPGVLGPAQSAGGAVRARWTGAVQIPQAGIYAFQVRTDGAARLSVDGAPVLAACAASDAVQPEVQLRLEPGWHPLQLDYIAQPGREALDLSWTPPGGARTLIPPAALRYAAADASAPVPLPAPPSAADCGPVTPPAAAVVPAAGIVAPTAVLTAAAGLQEPRGIGVARNGDLYIADSGNHRVVHLDAAGKLLGTWGSATTVSAPGKFGVIGDLAVTPDGQVATIDVATGDLQVFAPDGRVVRTVPGVAPNSSGLAVGPDGRFWIANTGGSRVLRFTPAGELEATITGAGGTEQPFEQPIDVAVAPDGTAYVVDLRRRIMQLDAGGRIVRHWAVDVGTARGGSHLAVWQGHVVLTDPDRQRLTILDPATGALLVLGEPGAGPGQFSIPLGVASGPGDRLYVVDSANTRVQVFGPLR
ncbi:MAG TPA: glycosyltransferase family 39 protein, partial [Chloroflexia bacterium]|nr:glycosyltransferase family 39 protein [Chloroflexia bacterium]